MIFSLILVTACSNESVSLDNIIENESDVEINSSSNEIIQNETIELIEESEEEILEPEPVEVELTYTTKEIPGCGLKFNYSSDWYVEVDKTPSEGIFFKAYYLNSSDLFIEVGQFRYQTEYIYAIDKIKEYMGDLANSDKSMSNFRDGSSMSYLDGVFYQKYFANYNLNQSGRIYFVKENIYLFDKMCDFTTTIREDLLSDMLIEFIEIESSLSVLS